MTLRDMWNQFFHEPTSPLPIAVYRIFFGLLVLTNGFLMLPDLYNFYGDKGIVSRQTAALLCPGARINLLQWWPGGDFGVAVFFALYMLAAFFLTLGFFTRTNALLVYVGMVSLHHRDSLILHSGDTFLRVVSFFLIFSHAGDELSLDRLWRLWRGADGEKQPLAPPWAQRLIQWELSLVYLCGFMWKWQGPDWRNGTALYYTSRLEEFYRFPVPYLFTHLWTIKLATWSTLFVEFCLGTAIWFVEFRYWVLAAGVALHLGIEYSMNIPLFEWTMIATYILFVDPADLRRVLDGARSWLRLADNRRSHVYFATSCPGCRQRAFLIAALDLRGAVVCEDVRELRDVEGVPPSQRGLLLRDYKGDWHADTAALVSLCRELPLCWPLAWLARVPLLGAVVEAFLRVTDASIPVSQGVRVCAAHERA
jgi:hypothetical protein